MRRTIWLASYPKSGNTWFRMLLANLGRDVPVDINDLPGRGGIASARRWFDEVMLFPSGLLTHDECDRLRPRVYEAIADHAADEVGAMAAGGGDPDRGPDADAEVLDDVRFVKTHDAWTRTSGGEPVLGGRRAADAAILIVRDPRDVVASLARHNRQSIDDAVGFMGRRTAAFCDREDRQPNQLRQQLSDWSAFHRGWIEQTDLPVHRVRYEDLKQDVCGVFARALAFTGNTGSTVQIAQAARFADFSALQTQERERGFREAPRSRPGATAHAFFRQGIAGGWRSELSDDQRTAIETMHGAMMIRLGYAPVASA